MRTGLASLAAAVLAGLATGQETREQRNVAILIFPGVELLDFAGPGEVFAAAGHRFNVYTVADRPDEMRSMGFLDLRAEFTIDDCPKPDIVIVPGGNVPARNERLQRWVADHAVEGEVLMSVCNGAHLLAAAGLLEDMTVTTHHSTMEGLKGFEPTATVLTNRRWVDNGNIITTAGISAGIDGSLYLVSRLVGEDLARSTARYMEYDWRPEEIAELHATEPIAFAPTRLDLLDTLSEEGLEAALAEHRELVRDEEGERLAGEGRLNRIGYQMLVRGDTEQAIRLFEFVLAAYPASANASDSLSEALEAAGQHERALAQAETTLAMLDGWEGGSASRKARVRTASTERITRLTDASARLVYACPPCGCPGDHAELEEPGPCPDCGMRMTQRTVRAEPEPRDEPEKEAGPVAYACPPCGSGCDGSRHDEPGNCPTCGMALVAVTGSETEDEGSAGS